MPTYEYVCKSCGHTFETVHSMTDDALTVCPECGGELRKVFGAPAIAFKGSGFYATDHGKKSRTSSEKPSEKSGEKSADKSGDTGGEKPAAAGEKKESAKPSEKTAATGSGSSGGKGGSSRPRSGDSGGDSSS